MNPPFCYNELFDVPTINRKLRSLNCIQIDLPVQDETKKNPSFSLKDHFYTCFYINFSVISADRLRESAVLLIL